MNNSKRVGLIDGLPNSYNTNYVLVTGKNCSLCKRYIQEADIQENKLIFTDEFLFYHKQCLEEADIKYEHQKPNDASSPIKLIK